MIKTPLVPKILASVLLCQIGTAALAGQYAKLAATVQANGGVLQIWAMGGLETQSTATLTQTAIANCHAIAQEGVTVTTVQILNAAGQILLVVNAATLAGC